MLTKLPPVRGFPRNCNQTHKTLLTGVGVLPPTVLLASLFVNDVPPGDFNVFCEVHFCGTPLSLAPLP